MFPLILSLNNINQEKVAICFSSLSPGKQNAASHSGFARFNSNLNSEVIFSKIKKNVTYTFSENPKPCPPLTQFWLMYAQVVSWVFRTFPLTRFCLMWSPKIPVMWGLSVFWIFKTQQHSVGSSRQVWPFLLTGFRDKVQQQGLCRKSTAQQKNFSNNKRKKLAL